MSTQDRNVNPGADAMENNLAGTRDEFNDEVTARLVEAAKPQEQDGDRHEEREEQPALEVDEETPASEAEASS
ncbi:hypothetical protein ACIQXM_08515 [Arthrobacter sp. NPDC097144]|uniref:hypothetical protein n=1 Tax=Arthrobacter sp. NPDC097144 TaxID=3363946 RepID=UPI0037F3A434